MACLKCDSSGGRNVLAHLVILEGLKFGGVSVDGFDVHDACVSVEMLVGTMLEGCEVKFSIPETVNGHLQDS